MNANNDTAGTTLDNDPVNQLRVGGQGIYYLGYSFDYGTRAGRITQALNERFANGKVDRSDMEAIQADVKLFDAEVFTPYILAAFERARSRVRPRHLRPAGDARVAEAVGRLGGVELHDTDGRGDWLRRIRRRWRTDRRPRPPRCAQRRRDDLFGLARTGIRNGVDTTLNALGVPTPGSGEAIKALRHLVERDGIGLSTVDFFGWAAPLACRMLRSAATT